MKILESKFVQGFIKMADDGYQQGWHERYGQACDEVCQPHRRVK